MMGVVLPTGQPQAPAVQRDGRVRMGCISGRLGCKASTTGRPGLQVRTATLSVADLRGPEQGGPGEWMQIKSHLLYSTIPTWWMRIKSHLFN